MSALSHFQSAVAVEPRQFVICGSIDIDDGGDLSRKRGSISNPPRRGVKTLHRQSEHKKQHQHEEQAFGYNTSPQHAAARSQGAFEKFSLSGSRRAGSSGFFLQGARRLQRPVSPGSKSIKLPTSSTCRVLFACSGISSFGLSPGTQPNPSLKASPNSVAHWPSSAGPSAHSALAVQRATLSVPP